MKLLPRLLAASLVANIAHAADWDETPVPANPGTGNAWQLHALSDDFNYDLETGGSHSSFDQRWKYGFINGWLGPGWTLWDSNHVSATDGNLIISASRAPSGLDLPDSKDANAPLIYMGSITSREKLQYPLFAEARVKLSGLVLANNFWLLDDGSVEEIDIIEAYGGAGVDNNGDGMINEGDGDESNAWFAERLHLSSHTFIREPFQDYQPSEDEDVLGTWYREDGRSNWRDEFIRVGMYWKNPHHLEYFVNGKWVRTITNGGYNYRQPDGTVYSECTNFNPLDKYNYTESTGLSEPMSVIINAEDQDWRSNPEGDLNLTPSDFDLADDTKNKYFIDWVRFYKPVPEDQLISGYTDGEVTTVEFESFSATGKNRELCCGDTSEGFTPGDTSINTNTAGDWGDYELTLEKGDYRFEFLVGSPQTGGIGANIYIDGNLASTISFAATDGWDDYQSFSTLTPISIDSAGDHTIRIESTGSSAWQWNGDKFNLVKLIPQADESPKPAPGPEAIPEPVDCEPAVLLPTPTPTATPTATPTTAPTRVSSGGSMDNGSGGGAFGPTILFWFSSLAGLALIRRRKDSK